MFKTFIIGLVALVVGVYFVTDLAIPFTQAAQDVFAKTQDTAVKIPGGFEGAGAIDFASSLFCWVIYHLSVTIKYVGPAILIVGTLAFMLFNRRNIIKEDKEAADNQ